MSTSHDVPVTPVSGLLRGRNEEPHTIILQLEAMDKDVVCWWMSEDCATQLTPEMAAEFVATLKDFLAEYLTRTSRGGRG